VKFKTGVGHTKRELFSDDNDVIYEHRRIISINGINVALTDYSEPVQEKISYIFKVGLTCGTLI